MSAQALFIVITILLLLAVILLFTIKAGLQLQYLRLSKSRKAGKIIDIVRFDVTDAEARAERWQAFLLFPMLYPLPLDKDQGEKLAIKKRVKRIHIFIYLVLIAIIVMAIYSEKVFTPA